MFVSVHTPTLPGCYPQPAGPTAAGTCVSHATPASPSLTYYFRGIRHAGETTVYFGRDNDDRPLPVRHAELPMSRSLNWGANTAECRQLAYAMLRQLFDAHTAIRHYRRMADVLIGRIAGDEFILPLDVIRNYVLDAERK